MKRIKLNRRERQLIQGALDAPKPEGNTLEAFRKHLRVDGALDLDEDGIRSGTPVEAGEEKEYEMEDADFKHMSMMFKSAQLWHPLFRSEIVALGDKIDAAAGGTGAPGRAPTEKHIRRGRKLR